MAHTYDLTTAIGKIRLLIGDTDIVPITDAQFSDEELTALYTMACLEYGNDAAIYDAAGFALDSWAATLTSGGASAIFKERIGDYSYEAGGAMNTLADQKMKAAKFYHDKAKYIPVFDWSEPNLFSWDTLDEDDLV